MASHPDRTLVPLGPDLWIVNNPHKWIGLDMRGRMTVMRLADGALVLHSPVPIDDTLAASLAELGPVQHLVAPNKFHHVYLPAAAARYPEAQVHMAPGLSRKRPEIKSFFSFDGMPHPHWAGSLEAELYAGAPLINEVALYHHASRSLVLTDLMMNVSQADGFMSQLVWKLEGVWGRPAVPRLNKFATRDKAAAASSIARISAWPFERIIVAHGEVIETDAEAIFAKAWAWLQPRKALAAHH